MAGAMYGSHCAQAVTVALTITVDPKATVAQQQLAENVLALMEIEAGRHEHLQIVERQRLELALHELALSGSQSVEAKARLGRLAGADLILTARLLNADDAGARNMHVQVTEAETAVVRGETLVPASAAEIEGAAAEIVDFLARVTRGPQRSNATIAVLPFESVERFDRLRPLERGLRDLFTSFFLRQEGTRVVQRTSMEQLLSELELVRGGLARDGRGLEGAPAREATYVLRGEIDERPSDEGNLVVIRVELIEPKSRKIVVALERAAKPGDVADTVTEMAEELSGSIAGGAPPPSASQPRGAQEVNRLYTLALRDVFRFVRHSPDDAGYIPFNIPGVRRPQRILPQVDPKSPLGLALLLKAIDRLESVLFIDPERLTAALPLAYCLSFHVEGAWRPEQCEALLRRIRDESPDSDMQSVATRLLGDMYFTHEGCLYSRRQVAEMGREHAQRGFERRLEAFAAMADVGRGETRPRMLAMLEKLCECSDGDERWEAVLETVAKVSAHANTARLKPEVQDNLAQGASNFAAQVIRTKRTTLPLKNKAKELLRYWAQSNDRWQWLHAARHLIILKADEGAYDDFDAKLDALFGNASTPHEQQCLTEQKTWLAIRLQDEGDVEAALQVLESFEPKNQTRQLGYDFTYCHYGYQLGRCYERLGRKQEAVAAYLHYAELPAGYHAAHDFMQRVDALGGVPLRADREIDVRYAEWAPGAPLYCRVLATDGKQVFCAGGFEHDGGGPQAIPISSVRALDLATGEWTTLGGPNDRVSCLAVADGKLWAGADFQGLWRMDLDSGDWRQWTTEDGLPTNSVVAVAASGATAYASVGNIDPSRQVVSGGMVRVQDDGVHVYRAAAAPLTAPVSLAINGRRLIASGVEHRLHVLDLKSDAWSTPATVRSRVVAASPSGIWTAPHQRVATLIDEDFANVKDFSGAALLKDYPAGMYLPEFILEQENNLWIGGRPWRRFGDSGLFRLNLTTGKLTRYGPRDGFRYDDNNPYRCYAAVWAGERLWVATSFGLAEVTIRENARLNR